MKIAIGCDHAAVDFKNALKKFLIDQGHSVDDVGTQGPESVDYPDFAALVAKRVVSGEAQRGVLCCGSGIGMAIAANKVPGARAWCCTASGRRNSHVATTPPRLRVLAQGSTPRPWPSAGSMYSWPQSLKAGATNAAW